MPDPQPMFTIPGTCFTPASTWAVACNDCGLRVRGFQEFEGSGADGLAYFRELLAEIGWVSDPPANSDLCPTCAGPHTAATIRHASAALAGAIQE